MVRFAREHLIFREGDGRNRLSGALRDLGCGDALADVLSAALLPNALFNCVEARSPWGLRVSSSDRAIFYLIARGHALLEVDGEPPRRLTSGDVVFIPHGTAHTLRDEVARELIVVHDGRRCVSTGPGPSRIGGDGALTILLTGFFPYAGDVRPSLLARVPRVVVISYVREAMSPLVGERGTERPEAAACEVRRPMALLQASVGRRRLLFRACAGLGQRGSFGSMTQLGDLAEVSPEGPGMPPHSGTTTWLAGYASSFTCS